MTATKWWFQSFTRRQRACFLIPQIINFVRVCVSKRAFFHTKHSAATKYFHFQTVSMGIILKIIMLKSRAYLCGCYPFIYFFEERENQVGQEAEPVLDMFINLILCGKTPCTMTHVLLFPPIKTKMRPKRIEKLYVLYSLLYHNFSYI